MKRFSFAAGVVCAQCGQLAQVVWAKRWEDACRVGVCETCYHKPKRRRKIVEANVEQGADVQSQSGEARAEDHGLSLCG
jgi:Zn ribbon nucleic-acid-binding protein